MDENEQKTAEDVRDAALDGVVEGVRNIADDVVSHRDDVTKKLNEAEAKREADKAELDAKMEKGFENILERQKRLDRRTSAVTRSQIGSGSDDLLEALPNAVKAAIPSLMPTCQTIKALSPESKLADPVFAMGVVEWFRLATKAQLPRFLQSQAETLAAREKLDKVFETMVPAEAKEISGETGHASAAENLIPTIVEAEILRLVGDAGDIWPLCRQFPMTSREHAIPDEQTSVAAGWVGEADELTASQPVFGQKLLNAEKLFGRATLTIEVIEDSAPALLTWLLDVFTEKMAGELDHQVMEGAGTGVDLGEPFTGIWVDAGVNEIDDGAAGTTAGITWGKLVALMYGVREASARRGGRYIMSPEMWSACLALEDSTGQPIVRLGAVEGAPAMTVLGRPVTVSARISAYTGTPGTNDTIVYGDLRYAIAGTRAGMRWEVTDQVNWHKYMIDCRLVGRFAFVLGVPGAFVRMINIEDSTP